MEIHGQNRLLRTYARAALNQHVTGRTTTSTPNWENISRFATYTQRANQHAYHEAIQLLAAESLTPDDTTEPELRRWIGRAHRQATLHDWQNPLITLYDNVLERGFAHWRQTAGFDNTPAKRVFQKIHLEKGGVRPRR